MTEQVIKLKAQLEAKEEMILFLKDIIQVLKIQLEKQANPLMGVAPYRIHDNVYGPTTWPPLNTYKVTTSNKILNNQFIGRIDVDMNEYNPSTTCTSNGTYIVSGSTGPYLSNCAEPYWKN